MNERVWHDIFKNYIECDKAIFTLKKNNVIDDEQRDELRLSLLTEILETLKSEVEE